MPDREAHCEHQEIATCLVVMEERKELRLQCMQTFKLEYENVRSQLHCPAFNYNKRVKAKDDLQLQREKLQSYLIVEENKAWRVVKLKWASYQKEREKQERRELFLQQLELSDLHSSRRCLHHFGWIPWKKRILSNRLLEERALLHSAISLLRRTLLAWKILLSSPEREVLMYKKLLYSRADCFRTRRQQKLCWRAWRTVHKTEKQYQQALLQLCFSTLKETCSRVAARYEAHLLKKSWSDWVQQVNVLKGAKLLKALASERIAAEHAQRTLQMHVFQSWHELVRTTRLEKQKIKRHAEAWCKIQSWLDELNQGKGTSQPHKMSIVT